MTVFIIIVGLLILAGLLFIVPPLLQTQRSDAQQRNDLNVSVYRDQLVELERDLANDLLTQAQYDSGVEEIERRLLDDVQGQDAGQLSGSDQNKSLKTAFVVMALLPISVISFYMLTGVPSAISPETLAQAEAQVQAETSSENMSEDKRFEQMHKLVAELAQHIEENPTDLEARVMLGRAYIAMESFDKALMQFEEAVKLGGGNAQLYADYADAMAMVQGETLEGQPMALLAEALLIDPNNQKALWLAGTAAFEQADFEQALIHWQRLRSMLPAGSDMMQTMDGNIAEASSLLRARGGVVPPVPVVTAAIPAQRAPMSANGGAAAGGASVSGSVSLAGSLASRAAPNDTVFIYARAATGPRMPLAAFRVQVKDLPITFHLDDSMAMRPSMSLSNFSEVVVSARISKSGNAISQTGDLLGESAVLQTGAEGVEIVIDRVVP